MFQVIKKSAPRLLAASLVVGAVAANAAVDTTDALAGITDATTAVGVIGGAVFLVGVAIAVYKWMRRSL